MGQIFRGIVAMAGVGEDLQGNIGIALEKIAGSYGYQLIFPGLEYYGRASDFWDQFSCLATFA